jgi:hypothetical protein
MREKEHDSRQQQHTPLAVSVQESLDTAHTNASCAVDLSPRPNGIPQNITKYWNNQIQREEEYYGEYAALYGNAHIEVYQHLLDGPQETEQAVRTYAHRLATTIEK